MTSLCEVSCHRLKLGCTFEYGRAAFRRVPDSAPVVRGGIGLDHQAVVFGGEVLLFGPDTQLRLSLSAGTGSQQDRATTHLSLIWKFGRYLIPDKLSVQTDTAMSYQDRFLAVTDHEQVNERKTVQPDC